MWQPVVDEARIFEVARERFGYEEFFPGQLSAIRSVLAGQDTLAVMPTGSGKSAIYQIAGLLMPGATIIVSPLIALQRDQVDSIREQDAAPGAEPFFLNTRVRRERWEEGLVIRFVVDKMVILCDHAGCPSSSSPGRATGAADMPVRRQPIRPMPT